MARKTTTKQPEALTDFEGNEVTEVEIKVTKTGDGLSPSLKVQPRMLHLGDEGYLILKYVVDDVQFPRSKPDDKGKTTVKRKHVLVTTGVAFADDPSVPRMLEQSLDLVAEELAELENKGTIFDKEHGGAAAAAETTNGRSRAHA